MYKFRHVTYCIYVEINDGVLASVLCALRRGGLSFKIFFCCCNIIEWWYVLILYCEVRMFVVFNDWSYVAEDAGLLLQSSIVV